MSFRGTFGNRYGDCVDANIDRFSWTTKSQTDRSRVDALTDETIDYRDIPATDIDCWPDAARHTRMDSVPKRTSH